MLGIGGAENIPSVLTQFVLAPITTGHRSERSTKQGSKTCSSQQHHMPLLKDASYVKSLRFVDAKTLGDARTQKLVRSHVMLEFGRQQRWHKSHGCKQRIEAGAASYEAEEYKQRDQDDVEDSPCASPISTLGAGRIDPFSCFPIIPGLRISALADHCGSSCEQAIFILAYITVSSMREATPQDHYTMC